ncbi:MAG: alpha/beta fold hydrolase [Saprospiraceae bacterium]|nr:alpha/beta fold hydrolase [Saprospiraceae bacterium]
MKSVLLFLIFACFTAKSQQGILQKTPHDSIHRIFGEGPPVLIINGGPGLNSDGFADFANDLSKYNFRTIIYDQRGTGRNTIDLPDSNNITMDLMVTDIENLRKKLKIQKWTVLGHSFGGLLATHYLAKHPENIDKIIFSSSGGVNLRFLHYIHERINVNLTEAEQDSLVYYQNNEIPESVRVKKRASFLAKAYVFDKSKSDLIAERLEQVNFRVNGLVFQDLRKIKFDYTDRFKSLDIPVLVIQGKNDIISTETAMEIKNSFGNASLLLLDNCGHYGWLDAREVYFTSIQKFLHQNQ